MEALCSVYAAIMGHADSGRQVLGVYISSNKCCPTGSNWEDLVTIALWADVDSGVNALGLRSRLKTMA